MLNRKPRTHFCRTPLRGQNSRSRVWIARNNQIRRYNRRWIFFQKNKIPILNLIPTVSTVLVYVVQKGAGMNRIRISTGGSVPIFRQVTDQIRSLVATGELAVGDSLPSVRALARELVVNPNTVAKAYAQLVRDGVLESQQGRGYFVAERRQIYTKTESRRRLSLALDPFVSEALTLGFTAEEILTAVEKRLQEIVPPLSSTTPE